MNGLSDVKGPLHGKNIPPPPLPQGWLWPCAFNYGVSGIQQNPLLCNNSNTGTWLRHQVPCGGHVMVLTPAQYDVLNPSTSCLTMRTILMDSGPLRLRNTKKFKKQNSITQNCQNHTSVNLKKDTPNKINWMKITASGNTNTQGIWSTRSTVALSRSQLLSLYPLWILFFHSLLNESKIESDFQKIYTIST